MLCAGGSLLGDLFGVDASEVISRLWFLVLDFVGRLGVESLLDGSCRFVPDRLGSGVPEDCRSDSWKLFSLECVPLRLGLSGIW